MLSHNLIIGFNLAFDVGVLLETFPEFIQEIFDAYEEGRFVDVDVLERLGEISVDKPAKYAGLNDLSQTYGLGKLNKEGGPRTTYARYLGADPADYTEEHRKYALRDGYVTYKVWQRARNRYKKVTLEAVQSESRHALWLHLCASWGFRTNPDNLEDLRRAAFENVERLRVEAKENGFIRDDDSKDTKVLKQAVWDAYGEKPPLAKKGQELVKKGEPWELKHVATNKVALADSGDPKLEAFAEYGEWAAVVNKDLNMLGFGVDHPIHTRYRMAATTRTTSSAPNVQNFRRLEGVRECVTPRPGHCFGMIDVGGLELGTLAQVIAWNLKSYNMANLINDGVDLHLRAACRLKGWKYDWAEEHKKDKTVKEWRQFCKIANFGYPGFMGAATLVPYARQQGVRITLEQAKDLKKNWAQSLPEAARYLKWIKTKLNHESGRYDFKIPGSADIFRAGATIASCANGHFQGLGAQVMKQCGWNLTKEAWTDRSSPLYGVHMWIFIHDEFGFEIPIGDQHHVMSRAREVMRATLHKRMPHVKLDAEPVAMALWAKDAEPVFDKKGNLEIWEP